MQGKGVLKKLEIELEYYNCINQPLLSGSPAMQNNCICNSCIVIPDRDFSIRLFRGSRVHLSSHQA